VAHFGLGSTTSVDSVIVCWPRGIVQVVSPAAIDRAFTVLEGVDPTPAVLARAEGVPVSHRLHAPIPNPFNVSTRIAFELPVSGFVDLMICDVAGRRARGLVNDIRGEGRHEVTWRGLDDGGRQVAAGVYFCRLRTGSFVETRRIALLK
jgi:hypothetical protein